MMMMMMKMKITFIEVKGQPKVIKVQIVNYVYGFQTLLEEPLIKIEDDHVPNRGQR